MTATGMADDLWPRSGDQRIDDMAGTPLRDQRNCLRKMRQSARESRLDIVPSAVAGRTLQFNMIEQ